MAEQAAHNRLVEGLLRKKPSTGESFRAYFCFMKTYHPLPTVEFVDRQICILITPYLQFPIIAVDPKSRSTL